MKIAILAAGKSDYFPVFIDKPKCLYHLNGKVQLERVIESCSKIVGEENLIVVAGYKSSYISKFLKKYPRIELRLNQNYYGTAIYSYREAAKNSTEDIVFLCADESISEKNIKRICDSKNKMALLCHDKYYFYSVGIFKLRYDQLGVLFDDKYLDMERMKVSLRSIQSLIVCVDGIIDEMSCYSKRSDEFVLLRKYVQILLYNIFFYYYKVEHNKRNQLRFQLKKLRQRLSDKKFLGSVKIFFKICFPSVIHIYNL